MNSYKAYLLIPLLVLIFFASVLHRPVFADESTSDKKWGPRFTFEYRPDRSRSLARFDALVPLRQNRNSLFFSDLRYIDTSGTGMEGNLGMGYRRLAKDFPLLGGDWIWGAYTFFDRRKTALANYFSQWTFGAELLTTDWSFRANGYLPDKTGDVVRIRTTPGTGGPTLSGTTVVGPADGSTLIDKEWALPGYDVELGYRIETLTNHALWLYAGYFHFDRSETPEISGPRARAEYRMHDLFDWTGSEITLGAEIREDDIGGTDGLVLARISIPLGKTGTAPQGLERRMTEFIQRDVDIVTLVNVDEEKSAGAPPVIVDPQTGEVLNVYIVNNDGTGDCTQNNPCSLATVANDPNYGTGDVIVLVDHSGNIVGDIDLTATVGNLGSDRRQVIGGEGDIVLNLSSGDNLSLTGLGGRPTLEGSVTLANESRVIGFDLVSPGTAIIGNGTDSTTLRDLRVINAENNALELQGVTGTLSVTDFSVQQAGGTGILLEGISANTTFGNTTINNSGQGLVVRNNTGDLNLGNVSIDNPTGTGIDVSGAANMIHFGDVEITNLGAGTGLNLNASPANVTVNSLDISGTGAAGSTGVDLAGATGALNVSRAGTIQNVVTGFNFDADSNAALNFQNGTINAGVPVNTVGVTNGTYDFTGTTFIKNNDLSLETGFGGRMYFVDATGDGAGTPDNPASADFVEANAAAGDVIFLVEDGTGNIMAAEGFQLQNNQQLLGFAAGDATMDFTGVNPRFLGQFVYAVSDPTGNGAASLSNNGGAAALELADGVQLRDFSISTTGAADGIAGNNFSGAIIHNLDIVGAGSHSIQLIDARGEVLISDSKLIDAGEEALNIVGGNANVRIENTEISGGQDNYLIAVQGTTGGSLIFDTGTTISSVGGRGILIDNIGGDITFNGPVNVTATLGTGVTATNLGTSTVSFNDRLDIRTENGSGLFIRGGTLNIAGGSINATGGTGITASNTTVDIVLDSLSATAGTDGLNLTNVSGSITILDRNP